MPFPIVTWSGYGWCAGGSIDRRGAKARGLIQRWPGCFPIPTIERDYRQRRQIDPFDAAHIDVDLIGMGARRIKSMDAAGAAEGVVGGAGVEAVGDQRLGALEQAEFLRLHDQVQETFLAADGAVAVGHLRDVGGHFKPHRPAMTTARPGPFHQVSRMPLGSWFLGGPSGGKCSARAWPQISMPFTKPSPGRWFLIPSTTAATAAFQGPSPTA